MNFAKKMKQKAADRLGQPTVTLAVIGDSVTQGCFEIYPTGPESLETVYEAEKAYGTRLKEMLQLLYPGVPVQLIAAGISGDSAAGGAARLERDVLRYHPDLTIVSYGLNDAAGNGEAGIVEYGKQLQAMFRALSENGSEVIYLTQNYMNTEVDPRLKEPLFLKLAQQFSNVQRSGILKAYYAEGKRIAASSGVEICDLYSVWETMEREGVRTTALLANYLNHPIREYHSYIAVKLLERILGLEL